MKVEFYQQPNHVPREVIDAHRAEAFDKIEFVKNLRYEGWVLTYSAKSLLFTRRLRNRTITLTVRDESARSHITLDLDVVTKRPTIEVKSYRTKHDKYTEAVEATQTMLDKHGRAACVPTPTIGEALYARSEPHEQPHTACQ